MLVENKIQFKDLIKSSENEIEDNHFNEYNMKILFNSPIIKRKEFNILELPSSNKYNNIKYIINSNKEDFISDNSTKEENNSIKTNLLKKFNSIEQKSKSKNLKNLIKKGKKYKNNFKELNDKNVVLNSYINNNNKINRFLEKLDTFLNFN